MSDNMLLEFYKTDDSENVINKTILLKSSININMKNDFDINSPSILLSSETMDNITDFNYCFLGGINRYYFVRSIENKTNELYELNLSCDVLETFKTSILSSQCYFNRSIQKGDFDSFSSDSDIRKEILIYKNNEILTDSKNMVFSTIGV